MFFWVFGQVLCQGLDVISSSDINILVYELWCISAKKYKGISQCVQHTDWRALVANTVSISKHPPLYCPKVFKSSCKGEKRKALGFLFKRLSVLRIGKYCFCVGHMSFCLQSGGKDNHFDFGTTVENRHCCFWGLWAAMGCRGNLGHRH